MKTLQRFISLALFALGVFLTLAYSDPFALLGLGIAASFAWPESDEARREREERERQEKREKEEKEYRLLREKELDQQAKEQERLAKERQEVEDKRLAEAMALDPTSFVKFPKQVITYLPTVVDHITRYLFEAKEDHYRMVDYISRLEQVSKIISDALASMATRLPPIQTKPALFEASLPLDIPDLLRPFRAYHELPDSADFIASLGRTTKRIKEKYGANIPVKDMDEIDQSLPPALQARFSPEDLTPICPFNIPRERWFEATWIVANQGRGKTNLMLHLLLNMPEPDATIIVLDPKNDIVNTVKRLKRFKDRLVILEADKDYPLALNPLRIGNGSDFLEYIFTALIDSAMTENQATLLKRVVALARCIPNATIDTVYQILVRGPGQFKEYIVKLKPRERDFFELQWDNRLYKDRRIEVVGRLENLYNNEFIDAILQSTTMQIDMTALMDSGSVICIDNSYNPKKLGLKGAEFFGRLFVALIWAAAIERSDRPVHKRKPVYVFIDEAHLLIGKDPVVADIIQQCRAQRIAMLFAHQEFHRITDSKVRNALKGCAIKFGNSVSEASELAPYFGTKEDFFRTNKALSQFCTYVFEAADPPVSVHCNKVDLTHEPKLTDTEYASVLKRSRDAYCQKPKDDPKPDAGAQRRDGGPRPPPPGSGPIIDDVDYSWDEKPKPEPEPDTPDMKRRAWLLSLAGPKKKSEPKKPDPPKGPRTDGREEI